MLDALRSGDAAETPRIAVVSGPAGIGKTAMALHWAHQARKEFPDGQLYANLRGHAADDPVEPAEVLGLFIRAFGMPPDRIPGGLAERAALYQSLVSDRRLIVVLDDALSAAQVIPLLPSSAGGVTIVTSRRRLAGLRSRGAVGVQLDRLSDESALELLSRTLGDDRVRREHEAALALVDLCACFPLALCVMAARLATRPRWALAEMVEALTQERRRLIELPLEDEMPIRAALTLSYRNLPPDAARAYRLLGLLPGSTFDDWTAAAALDVPRTQTGDLIAVLVDANMLDDATGGSYRFHDLTRLHARELAVQEDSAETRESVMRRVLDRYLTTTWTASRTIMPYRLAWHSLEGEPAEGHTFTAPTQALDWLDHEFGNLRAAVRAAVDLGMSRTAWELVDAMWPLFVHRGHYAERLEIDLLGMRAAQADGNRYGEAKMLNRVGLAQRALGHTEKAVQYFEQALEIWTSLGERGRIAGSRRRLAIIELDRERSSQAAALFRQALDDYRALGDVRRTAITACDLADALLRGGDEQAALGHLGEAQRLLEAVDDRYSRARVLILLGRAQFAGPETAATLLEQGLQGMRDLGSVHGQARALEALGELALRLGRRTEAHQHFLSAQNLLVKAGARSDRLAELLSRLGDG
ncbi:tetratricopeptide repeat protein [Sphaerisporangium rubeum]|uniref:Tetratricopeptide (TPR) repeat protein n=1 Tax=Sphaerisporangium rubeum TaxID=321317 RepID=A0A7X0I8V4_9ACTN|nr:tetratricopeptide repeat protein [Sphaerisporangium rubeum]MBB6470745.1 tetratricopeptide (TPR) repeat protein [Sphaerisporangium rubeum]